MTLGGSVFIRNAIQYDYCIKEAIQSILFCDEVVVLDCQSDDGTTEMLSKFCSQHPNIKYITNGNWNSATDYKRLANCANEAKSYLKTDWHFMIQADEVLHQDSYNLIKNAIESNESDLYSINRINLWGDSQHYIGSKIPPNKHPCNSFPARLGKLNLKVIGDAESLKGNECIAKKDIKLFHYGLLRNNLVDKILDMQTWFFGNPNLDPRVLKMKQDDGIWKAYSIHPLETLDKLTIEHPIFMKQWLKERN